MAGTTYPDVFEVRTPLVTDPNHTSLQIRHLTMGPLSGQTAMDAILLWLGQTEESRD